MPQIYYPCLPRLSSLLLTHFFGLSRAVVTSAAQKKIQEKFSRAHSCYSYRSGDIGEMSEKVSGLVTLRAPCCVFVTSVLLLLQLTDAAWWGRLNDVKLHIGAGANNQDQVRTISQLSLLSMIYCFMSVVCCCLLLLVYCLLSVVWCLPCHVCSVWSLAIDEGCGARV